jgi:sporulation protein YlmC with PRC-barrel domain
MPDPVSWLVIEPGWEVVTSDGERVGEVKEVVGDTNADIFDGLSVATGLLKREKYVPSERVNEIVEGEVKLDLTGDDFGRLDDFAEPPPSERFLAP